MWNHINAFIAGMQKFHVDRHNISNNDNNQFITCKENEMDRRIRRN